MQLQVSWLPDHRSAAPSQDGTEPSQWLPAASLPGHSGEDRAGIAPASLGLRAATYQTGNAPTWPHGSPLRSSQEEACELANRCHDTGPAPLHLLVPVILAAGLAPACGDDDEDDTSSTDASAATEAESTVKVTAVDYGLTGLPDSIEAGAHITMHNDSQAEVHELVAFEIPPEETRSAGTPLAPGRYLVVCSIPTGADVD